MKEKILKMELSYNPEIPLLGIDTKEIKLAYQRDIHTCTFIDAGFTTDNI
jgi:hypothetical protein